MARIDDLANPIQSLDLPAEHRARAVRAVASVAADADECRALLDILGLSAGEGVPDGLTEMTRPVR